MSTDTPTPAQIAARLTKAQQDACNALTPPQRQSICAMLDRVNHDLDRLLKKAVRAEVEKEAGR